MFTLAEPREGEEALTCDIPAARLDLPDFLGGMLDYRK